MDIYSLVKQRASELDWMKDEAQYSMKDGVIFYTDMDSRDQIVWGQFFVGTSKDYVQKESEDIYEFNNEKSLNQLFLLAFNKAKESRLVKALYDEYINSIDAINKKKLI